MTAVLPERGPTQAGLLFVRTGNRHRGTEKHVSAQGPRVAVIGLDCATPQLLFEDLAAEVPNINELMARGMHGDLASITPPITVPGWACAMTGKTPGQLGIY